MTDEDLLKIVKAERVRSIGFDHDEELRSAREKALNYRKGVMPDVPSLANRSAAVSTDVADAIETILPDLIEIFTGGDDVAAFQATPKSIEPGEIDKAEKQAQQETDYVNHVVFEQNAGFMVLNTFFKDALEVKTGVVKWWWEEAEEAENEKFCGKTLTELQLALQDGGQLASEPKPCDECNDAGEPLYDFELEADQGDGRVCIMAVAPEDFTVAPDTIALKDAPYCAHRSRPRAQDLLARDIPADLVDQLGAYDRDDDTIDQARDTAGEHDNSSTNDAHRNMRQVEVVEHYVRLDGKIWRVLTGKGEALLLEKEEVSEIQFAAITPFVVTHRFYGESIADKLMEVQKIKTVLMRMMLDSGYFALNQRVEVDMLKASEFTMSDLLRNEPAMPIRVSGDGALKPIQSGNLNFDVHGALEYMSVVAESRTGITRNAQGLNPDTLHDTAKGAMALMNAAQRRTRMIARIFAEMGVKDLFLGVHALLRRHSSKAAITRLRGSWVEVNPSQWAERNDMTIEVGLGASGAEAEIMAMREITPLIEGLMAQGSPVVSQQNVYALMRRFLEKLKFKGVERYLTDPASLPPQPPQPDPEMAKVQADAQLAQQKMQIDAQSAQQKAQIDLQTTQAKHAAEMEQATQKAQADLELQREKITLEMQFKRDQATAELQLKREEMQLEYALKTQVAEHDAKLRAETTSAKINGPHQGGEPG